MAKFNYSNMTLVNNGLMAMIFLMMSAQIVTSAVLEEVGDINENESKTLTDITWMGTKEKKILQNFITWYKLALQTAVNVLNPKAYNFDIVMPAVSGVISLYTGPVLALALILFVFYTITTFAEGMFSNRNSARSKGYNFRPTLDALTYVVQNAINKY